MICTTGYSNIEKNLLNWKQLRQVSEVESPSIFATVTANVYTQTASPSCAPT